MAIGMGNLLDAFVENGLTNHVKGGILHMSRPPQAVEVESEADLEALGELPAGSIAYTAEYAHMWQLTGSGTWAATEEKGGSGGGGGAMLLTVTKYEYDNRTIYELSKTWKEIKDALAEGTHVVLYGEGAGEFAGLYMQFMVSGVGEHDGIYTVINNAEGFNYSYEQVMFGVENQFTTTSSEDGYPMVVINH